MANFEGTLNDPTLTCNVTNNDGSQGLTRWNVANFEGVSGTRPLRLDDEEFLVGGDVDPVTNFPFQNRITIVNWTLALDEVTLFCGTGANLSQVAVNLRIYSKIFRESL